MWDTNKRPNLQITVINQGKEFRSMVYDLNKIIEENPSKLRKRHTGTDTRNIQNPTRQDHKRDTPPAYHN